MEYLLENSNWFYLFGILSLIGLLFSFINKCREFNGIKPVGIISSLFFYVNILWIIVGIINHDRILFLALFFSWTIVPIILHLGDYKKIFSGAVNGKFYTSEEVVKEIDVDNYRKHRKFFALLTLIDILIVIVILVNHFKHDIFYMTA